jgi:hypothetical protein
MPSPVPSLPCHSDKAPHFYPKDPSSLEDYFTDFEILPAAAQLKEEDKVINAMRYAPPTKKDFWTSIPEYDNRPADYEADYEAYKKAIYMRYLGLSAKEKWLFWDLENLC